MPNASVLVIEDSDDQRELLASVFMDAGLEVAAFGNPLEALPQIETRRPTVIVMDWCMPLLGGEALVKLIRSRPQLARVSIVVLTGLPGLNPSNVDAVLLKPVDVHEILSVVHRQIHRVFHAELESPTTMLG